ncbi:MAG: hypothetical protein QG630_80 [Patescibacteria group bacterium]|nr:hypothetical protein [Patescibacteria group bacterium]
MKKFFALLVGLSLSVFLFTDNVSFATVATNSGETPCGIVLDSAGSLTPVALAPCITAGSGGGANNTGISNSNSTSNSTPKVYVNIKNNLKIGSRDSFTNGDVTKLQTFLIQKGYLSSAPTGYFGTVTQKAVIQYQKSLGLTAEGFVGGLTRNMISIDGGSGNSISGSNTSTNDTGKTISPVPTITPTATGTPIIYKLGNSDIDYEDKMQIDIYGTGFIDSYSSYVCTNTNPIMGGHCTTGVLINGVGYGAFANEYITYIDNSRITLTLLKNYYSNKLMPGIQKVSVIVNGVKSNEVNFNLIERTATGTPSITVLSPNGGESYKAGGDILVKWSTNNKIPSTDKIKLSLGYNGAGGGSAGDIWLSNLVGSQSFLNDGSETVQIPKNLPWASLNEWFSGKHYTISAETENYYPKNLRDVSDNLFTIDAGRSSPIDFNTPCTGNTIIVKENGLINSGGTPIFSKLGMDISSRPEILKYRIQWFNGSWSPWYVPGVNDQDWKNNYDGTTRRIWSYFDDHVHEYEKCISTASKLKAVDGNAKSILINNVDLITSNTNINIVNAGDKLSASFRAVDSGGGYGIPSDGFNVKYTVEKMNGQTATYNGNSIAGNATFTSSSRNWEFNANVPNQHDRYNLHIQFYCDNTNKCDNSQVVDKYYDFYATTTRPSASTSTTAPSLIILSPNGGESYKYTDTLPYRYKLTHRGFGTTAMSLVQYPSDTNPGIKYNFGGGTGDNNQADYIMYGNVGTIGNLGNFTKTVVPGKYYFMVNFKSSDGKVNLTDFSDSPFYIMSTPTTPTPSITVLSPNGGETFTTGQQITVKWSSVGIPTSNNKVAVLLQGDNISASLGPVFVNNSGQSTVTIPTWATPGKYKISIGTIDDNNKPLALDYSDSHFYISATGVNSYTITFDSKGASTTPNPISVTQGQSTTIPYGPVRSGYTFGGWYTPNTINCITTPCPSNYMTIQPGSSFTPKSNITFYAIWNPIKVIPIKTPVDSTSEGIGTPSGAGGYVPAVNGLNDSSLESNYRDTTNNPLPTVYGVGSYQFAKSLTVGMRGDDVKMLQKFLNTQGYKVDLSGYYGQKTKEAVTNFQNAHKAEILDKAGIDQGTGDFFFLTLSFVNDLLLNSTTINLNN